MVIFFIFLLEYLLFPQLLLTKDGAKSPEEVAAGLWGGLGE